MPKSNGRSSPSGQKAKNSQATTIPDVLNGAAIDGPENARLSHQLETIKREYSELKASNAVTVRALEETLNSMLEEKIGHSKAKLQVAATQQMMAEFKTNAQAEIDELAQERALLQAIIASLVRNKYVTQEQVNKTASQVRARGTEEPPRAELAAVVRQERDEARAALEEERVHMERVKALAESSSATIQELRSRVASLEDELDLERARMDARTCVWVEERAKWHHTTQTLETDLRAAEQRAALASAGTVGIKLNEQLEWMQQCQALLMAAYPQLLENIPMSTSSPSADAATRGREEDLQRALVAAERRLEESERRVAELSQNLSTVQVKTAEDGALLEQHLERLQQALTWYEQSQAEVEQQSQRMASERTEWEWQLQSLQAELNAAQRGGSAPPENGNGERPVGTRFANGVDELPTQWPGDVVMRGRSGSPMPVLGDEGECSPSAPINAGAVFRHPLARDKAAKREAGKRRDSLQRRSRSLTTSPEWDVPVEEKAGAAASEHTPEGSTRSKSVTFDRNVVDRTAKEKPPSGKKNKGDRSKKNEAALQSEKEAALAELLEQARSEASAHQAALTSVQISMESVRKRLADTERREALLSAEQAQWAARERSLVADLARAETRAADATAACTAKEEALAAALRDLEEAQEAARRSQEQLSALRTKHQEVTSSQKKNTRQWEAERLELAASVQDAETALAGMTKERDDLVQRLTALRAELDGLKVAEEDRVRAQKDADAAAVAAQAPRGRTASAPTPSKAPAPAAKGKGASAKGQGKKGRNKKGKNLAAIGEDEVEAPAEPAEDSPEVADLKSAIATLEMTNASLEAELDQLRRGSTRSSPHSSPRGGDGERRELRNELENLRELLAESKILCADLEARLATSEAERAAVSTDLEDITRSLSREMARRGEIQQLEEEKAATQVEQQQLRDSLKAADEELQSQEERYTRLHEVLLAHTKQWETRQRQWDDERRGWSVTKATYEKALRVALAAETDGDDDARREAASSAEEDDDEGFFDADAGNSGDET